MTNEEKYVYRWMATGCFDLVCRRPTVAAHLYARMAAPDGYCC